MSPVSWLMLAVCVGMADNSATNGRLLTVVFRQRLRQYFDCVACDAGRCGEVSEDCEETVMEVGVCACCMVCALTEGSPCGVDTAPCASHLSCTPAHHDDYRKDILLLLQGRGVCQPSQQRQSSLTFFLSLLSVFTRNRFTMDM